MSRRSKAKTIAAAQLSAAVLAVIGCVWSWLAAASPAQIEPVVAGEQVHASTSYDPLLLTASLLLATLAGVLVVLGVGRLRHTS